MPNANIDYVERTRERGVGASTSTVVLEDVLSPGSGQCPGAFSVLDPGPLATRLVDDVS